MTPATNATQPMQKLTRDVLQSCATDRVAPRSPRRRLRRRRRRRAAAAIAAAPRPGARSSRFRRAEIHRRATPSPSTGILVHPSNSLTSRAHSHAPNRVGGETIPQTMTLLWRDCPTVVQLSLEPRPAARVRQCYRLARSAIHIAVIAMALDRRTVLKSLAGFRRHVCRHGARAVRRRRAARADHRPLSLSARRRFRRSTAGRHRPVDARRGDRHAATSPIDVRVQISQDARLHDHRSRRNAARRRRRQRPHAAPRRPGARSRHDLFLSLRRRRRLFAPGPHAHRAAAGRRAPDALRLRLVPKLRARRSTARGRACWPTISPRRPNSRSTSCSSSATSSTRCAATAGTPTCRSPKWLKGADGRERIFPPFPERLEAVAVDRLEQEPRRDQRRHRSPTIAFSIGSI